MKLMMTAALALALAIGSVAKASDLGEPQDEPSAAARAEGALFIDRIGKALKGDDQDVIKQIDALTSAPAFNALSPAERYRLLSGLGAGLHAAKRDTVAHAVLVRATSMDEAQGQQWLLRFFTADPKDDAENLLCLATLAQQWPTLLDQVNEGYIIRLIHRTAGKAQLASRRLQAMEALRAANWPGDDSRFTPNSVWLDLVNAYLDQGQTHRAAVVAQQITDPRMLIDMRIGKRYAPLRAELGDQLDIAKGQAAYLASLKAQVTAHPDSLSDLTDLAFELTLQNQPEQALALLDAAKARLQAAPANAPPFSDAQTQRNWLEDNRSHALKSLGRYDEAITAMTAAAAIPEEGSTVNTSQAINLGNLMLELGRAKEALAAVAGVTDKNASPYGLMQAWDVRARAYAQLGDTTAYQTQLKILREHQADAPCAVEEVLIGANDLDAAAALMIQRLKTPDQCGGALREAQIYLHKPHETDIDREVDRRTKVIMSRPDVQVAIQEVGEVISIPRTAP